MKRFLCVIQTFLFLVATGCAVEEKTQENTTSFTQRKTVSYTIYADSAFSLEGTVASTDTDSSIETGSSGSETQQIQSWNNRRTYFSDAVEMGTTELSDPISKTIGEKDYAFQRKISYTAPADTALSDNLNHDEYVQYNSNGDLCTLLRVRQKDNLVLSFYDLSVSLKERGPVTQEEAKEIAETFLCQLYGSDVASSYSYLTMADTSSMKQNGSFEHGVIFVRMVEGYETEDTIHVGVNEDGEICYLNALNFGVADAIPDDITQEGIEAAQAVMEERLSKTERYTIVDDVCLVMGDDGRCYLRQGVLVTLEWGEYLTRYYINVN